jgi:hypothetical protein
MCLPARLRLPTTTNARCTVAPIEAQSVDAKDWPVVRLAIRRHPPVPVSANAVERRRSTT